MDEDGSSNLFLSEISSSNEISGGQQENKELNYLFVFDNETNQYETNGKCEKDLKNDEVQISKDYTNKDSCPSKRSAVQYFREVIENINKELKNPSTKIPIKSSIIHFLEYLGCFLVFLLIIYLFLLVLVLFLFNPMIAILEILFVRSYLNFFLSVRNGINENKKQIKIISLLNGENGKYTHKGKTLEWKYGRDGSWIEIRYKKKKDQLNKV